MGGVNLVTGFRPELWREVAPDDAPPEIEGFNEDLIGIDGFVMPATQHDAVLWLSGSAYDVVFDIARQAIGELGGLASLGDETSSWPYRHDRDLTGFIDGTENPSLIDAPEVALIPDGAAGAGGTILLLQKWVHDAPAWEALPVAGQEGVMGRAKLDSVELENKASDSHVASTDQERFGKIFRRNMPFGTVTNHGTVFVGRPPAPTTSCHRPRMSVGSSECRPAPRSPGCSADQATREEAPDGCHPTGFLVLTKIVVGAYDGEVLDLAVIEDPMAAEVSLDPVRVRLLAELAEPGTATMLATRLGLPRQNVNYHLKALERHGLVELREERRKGNVTERLLQATALSYVISPVGGGAAPRRRDQGPQAARDLRHGRRGAIRLGGRPCRVRRGARDRGHRADRQIP